MEDHSKLYKTNVSLSQELHRRFKALCQRKRMKMQTVIGALVEDWLRDYGIQEEALKERFPENLELHQELDYLLLAYDKQAVRSVLQTMRQFGATKGKRE